MDAEDPRKIHDDAKLSAIRATRETIDDRKQHFGLWSTLGLSYSIMNTPIALASTLILSVGVGGSPVYIFAYCVAFVFQVIVCVSLAEMAGAFPHPSAQVYWTSQLAPQSLARILCYISACFMIAGWVFGFVATVLNATLLFFSVVQLPQTLHIAAYHDYLGFVAIVGVALAMNLFFFRFYMHILRGMVLLINGTVLLVIISLLVRTSPKRSAQEVFGHFVNTTGWQSDGFVFLLGLLPGLVCINAFDSAAHLTHEMPKPKVQTPQVMLGSTILGGLSGIPMALVVMFCVSNPEALLTPIGGQPIVQLLKDSLHSTSLSVLIGILMVITLIMGAVAGLTTTSRVVWSMTADNLFIFQEWLAELSEEGQLPVHILVMISVLSCLIGLIQLGSATALNALAGAVVNCFMISYLIPIACLLCHKGDAFPQDRYCRLGVASRPVNLISLIWIIFVDVITCFPQYLPVTASNMNYTGPILVGVATLFGLNWVLHARKHYQLPQALLN